MPAEVKPMQTTKEIAAFCAEGVAGYAIVEQIKYWGGVMIAGGPAGSVLFGAWMFGCFVWAAWLVWKYSRAPKPVAA
jgi:hypothetical protein